jgi:hypothetical protein
MNVIGRGATSLRKTNTIPGSANPLSVGYKKIKFAHQATVGDASIDLTALVFPASLTTSLISNPSAKTLQEANLKFFSSNMTLLSTARGVLIPDVSYTCTNTSINFIGLTALSGEIFYGVIDYVSSPNTLFVDAKPTNVSKTLNAGVKTFNVGEAFKVNSFPNDSSGSVKVFVNGALKYRNTNNSSTVLDRDYYEVPTTEGFGTTIEFNVALGTAAQVTVMSNSSYVDRPDFHIMQRMDVLAAQLTKLAQLTGQNIDLSAFPNAFDLSAFGSRLLSLEANKNKITKHSLATGIFQQTVNDVPSLRFNNLTIGKQYELTINISASVPAGSNVQIWAKNNGSVIGVNQIQQTSSYAKSVNSAVSVFTAEATSVTFDASVSNVANCYLVSGSTNTYVILEELNNATVGAHFD